MYGGPATEGSPIDGERTVNLRSGMARPWIIVAASWWLLLCARVDAQEDARESLAKGLTAISAPGNPGGLVLTGKDAFAIVATQSGEVVVAGTTWGKGRVVVFGHPGYLEAGALEGEHGEQTRELMRRLIGWAAGEPERRPVYVLGDKAWIDELDLDASEYEASDREWGSMLLSTGGRQPRDVIVRQSHDMNDAWDREVMATRVTNGAGLITAGLGWGWLQLNPGKTIQEHPGNLLLRDAGIAFADGIVEEDAGDGYAFREVSPEATHAGLALSALEAWIAGGSVRPDAKENKEAARAHGRKMEAMVATIRRALSIARPGDEAVEKANDGNDAGGESFGARVDALIAAHAGDLAGVFATMHENGLRARDNPLAVLAVDRFVARDALAKPGDVVAFAGHVGFPGAVARDADRSIREVTIDTSIPGWRATGLFVPAGEVVRLQVVPPETGPAVDASALTLQIGAHLDPASRPPLRRLPVVTRRFAISAEGRSEIASSVGGLLYLDVPKGIAPSVRLRVTGAVLTPHFVLGKTTGQAWRATIRNHPGPWAELESREIALTVPSEVARRLDDPQPLLEVWDRIVVSHGSLEPRRLDGLGDRQARYVPDVNVSWGYMYAPAHAPLTVPMESAAVMTDVGMLTTNSHGDVWGLLHELGHWHQNEMWTFEGTGEVTVNLFTLHAIGEICGMPSADAREETFKPETMLATMRGHMQEGSPFEKWKQDPFLALTMYVQLQQAFGWDLYRDVFAEYRTLPEAERPANDDEKRDQWLERLSRATGRNLGPFFTAWGVPTSEVARTSVATLPVWMPDGWHSKPK